MCSRDVHSAGGRPIDGGRILANLAGLEEGDKKKLLADGLSELIYMECHRGPQGTGSCRIDCD